MYLGNSFVKFIVQCNYYFGLDIGDVGPNENIIPTYNYIALYTFCIHVNVGKLDAWIDITHNQLLLHVQHRGTN